MYGCFKSCKSSFLTNACLKLYRYRIKDITFRSFSAKLPWNRPSLFERMIWNYRENSIPLSITTHRLLWSRAKKALVSMILLQDNHVFPIALKWPQSGRLVLGVPTPTRGWSIESWVICTVLYCTTHDRDFDSSPKKLPVAGFFPTGLSRYFLKELHSSSFQL